MGKTISSPVERWPGTVTLYDPMTLLQEAAWEDAFLAARSAKSRAGSWLALLPGILACVQEWRLEGVPERPTVETFPVRPREDAARLIAWLITEITELYREASDVPNA